MRAFFRSVRGERVRKLDQSNTPTHESPASLNPIPTIPFSQVALEYQYQPLLKSGDIRIFKFHTNYIGDMNHAISGELETINLNDTEHVPYTALSYTWDSPFPPLEPWSDITYSSCKILCSGRSLVVGGNLHDALLRLLSRHPSSAYYWIDALCINQDDESERSSQVRRMGDIYAEAGETIVWLGREDAASKVAFPLLDEFTAKFQAKEAEVQESIRFPTEFNNPKLFFILGLHPFSEEEWRAILDLFTRTWFQRLWVSQEFALSRSLVFMCGSLVLSRQCVIRFVQYIEIIGWRYVGALRRRRDKHLHSFSGITGLYTLALLRDIVVTDSESRYLNPTRRAGIYPYFVASTKSQVNGALLGSLIQHSAPCLCSDPRDKVFAPLALSSRIIGLSDDLKAFPLPDYSKSIEEICIETSRFLLESASGLGLLSMIERREPPVLDMPTWAVDFARIKGADPLGTIAHDATKFWASGGHRLNGGLLIVWGIKFDDILYTTIESTRAITDLGAMLRICATLESTDQLKHRSVRTLLEILCQDPSEGLDLDDPIVISAVKHYIQFFLVQNVSRKSYHSTIPFDFLADQVGNPFLPSPAELRDFHEQYKKYSKVHSAARDATMTAPMHLVRRIFDGLLQGRCIGGTSKGNLALCPGVTHPGDEIWFLRGAKVPFMLRPLQNGNYEVVGESCLHGFMQGEIFGVGGKNIEDSIEISIQ